MLEDKLLDDFADSIVQIGRLAGLLKASDIANIPQFLALHKLLTDKTPTDITAITQHVGMAMPNAIRMVNAMQESGFVARDKQGRHVYVTVTEKGAAYHKTCMEQIKKFIADFWANIPKEEVSEEELESFLRTGRKLRAAYEKNLLKGAE